MSVVTFTFATLSGGVAEFDVRARHLHCAPGHARNVGLRLRDLRRVSFRRVVAAL